MKLKPIPKQYGLGFTTDAPNPEFEELGYSYKQQGYWHNYFYTDKNRSWPEGLRPKLEIVDGFSPNLNKEIHVGHLKNLAIAAAISNISGKKTVALLGAARGINKYAYEDYLSWCSLARYEPITYKDIDFIELPKEIETRPGEGEYKGCLVWNNIVLVKSDGKPTYAFYDLCFKSAVSPSLYLVGSEQKNHFESLGMLHKFKPLGLVLGSDGKKMRSRDGGENAMSAKELLDTIVDSLQDHTPDPIKLAWNVLAYGFNCGTTSSTTKFILDKWLTPTGNTGVYVSYTYARIKSALDKVPHEYGLVRENTPIEHEIAAIVSYFNYYYNAANTKNEPLHIARYLMDLCVFANQIYKDYRFNESDPVLLANISVLLSTIGNCMDLLSMHRLDKV